MTRENLIAATAAFFKANKVRKETVVSFQSTTSLTLTFPFMGVTGRVVIPEELPSYMEEWDDATLVFTASSFNATCTNLKEGTAAIRTINLKFSQVGNTSIDKFF